MKRTSIIAMAMAIGMLSAPAMAQEIVTLKCMVPNGSGADAEIKPWDVTIDEANQSVSWSHEYATVQNKAIFTPNRITMVDTRSARSKSLDPTEESYFDRQTGEIVFISRFGNRVGKCERVTVSQKF